MVLPLRCSLFRQSFGVPTTAQQLGIVNSPKKMCPDLAHFPPPRKKKGRTNKKERNVFSVFILGDRFFFVVCFAFLYQLCFEGCSFFFWGGGGGLDS